MNCLLKFSESKIERRYQAYIDLFIGKKLYSYFYLILGYGLIHIFSIILQYFFSNQIELRRPQTLILRLTITLLCCIMSAVVVKIAMKYDNCFSKNIEIVKLSFGILFQVVYDVPLMNMNESLTDLGYELFWESYEIQLFILLICATFRSWTYKTAFFFLSSLYYAIMKVSTIEDRLINIKVFGVCIIFGIFTYQFEKTYRQNFHQFHRFLQKEKLWKGLLDDLPESLMIIDNDNSVVYKNHSLIKLYKIEVNGTENTDGTKEKRINDFVDMVTNLTLRCSIKDLKLKYQHSFSLSKNIEILLKPEIDSQADQLLYNKINENPKKEDKISILPWVTNLSDKIFNLKQLVRIMNSNIQSMVENKVCLTFDGLCKDKSIELKLTSISFEGKQCLVLFFADTSQRDLISKLEQNDKYKNIVLSTVSHELRNPLNSSLSLIQLAVDDVSLSQHVKVNLLEPALRSLGMLATLINDILDYSQIQANKLKLVFQYVNLRQVICDTCILIESQCKRKGIELKINIEEDIPDSFKTDPNRLTQILMNLLSNALKFTLKGYIKISAKVINKIMGLVEISVEDTGIGMKSEDIGGLFREYGKIDLGDNSKMNPTGCGLGLNISQKLARRLGKDEENENIQSIKVRSEVNKGSLFYFVIHDKNEDERISDFDIYTKIPSFNPSKQENTISEINTKSEYRLMSAKDSNIINRITSFRNLLIVEDQSENADNSEIDEGEKEIRKYVENYLLSESDNIHPIKTTQEEESKLVEVINTRNKLRILAIDDDEFNLHSLKMMLDSLDIEHNIANSGENAIKLIKQSIKTNKHFHLVLMDCSMPIMDGFMTTEIIRKLIKIGEIPNVLIIGCTGYSDENSKIKCRISGMDDVLVKPITKVKLMNLISRYKATC